MNQITIEEQFHECPYCHSDALEFTENHYTDGECISIIECMECGKSWEELWIFRYSYIEGDENGG